MGLPANICLQIIGSFLPSTSTLFLQPHFMLRLWQTANGFHLLPRQVGSPCSAVSQLCVMQNILSHPSFFALILSSRHFFSVPGVVVVPSFEADENQNPPASKAELDECISAQRCRGVLEVVHISSHLTPHTSHLTPHTATQSVPSYIWACRMRIRMRIGLRIGCTGKPPLSRTKFSTSGRLNPTFWGCERVRHHAEQRA